MLLWDRCRVLQYGGWCRWAGLWSPCVSLLGVFGQLCRLWHRKRPPLTGLHPLSVTTTSHDCYYDHVTDQVTWQQHVTDHVTWEILWSCDLTTFKFYSHPLRQTTTKCWAKVGCRMRWQSVIWLIVRNIIRLHLIIAKWSIHYFISDYSFTEDQLSGLLLFIKKNEYTSWELYTESTSPKSCYKHYLHEYPLTITLIHNLSTTSYLFRSTAK